METVLCAAAAHVALKHRLFLRLLRFESITVLIAGVAAGSLVLMRGPVQSSLPLAAAIACCAVAAVCDAQTGYIFDAVTLPSIVFEVAASAATGKFAFSIAGTAVLAASLTVLFALTRGRGLGLGDVKLAACIGAGAGCNAGLSILGGAFVAGGAYAAFLLLTKRAARGQSLAFGPYLAAATATLAVIRPW
jgi:leader peptidase (prepilin peptidase)/N-methyltransferase